MKAFSNWIAKKAITIGSVLALSFVLLLGVQQYRSHIPVLKEGECLVFSFDLGLGATDFAIGKVKSNNIQKGEMLVETIFPVKGFVLSLDYKDVRDYGYIRANCKAF